jgi:cytochrome b561
MALLAFYVLFVAVILIGFVTQILMPWARDTKLFPMFRKNELADQVEELRSEVSHLRESNTLTALRDKLLDEKETLSRKD